MCGRFTQYRHMKAYLDQLDSQASLVTQLELEPIGRYNVPPRTRVNLIHHDEDGLRASPILWGYQPFWAKGKRPPAINARLETAATGRYWRGVWKRGRAVVPADGWFEWVTDETNPKQKQPYYIRYRSNEPMFFAAIGSFPRAGAEPSDEDGFAIITADSDAGMVDIHDRRPVVLAPDVARQWLESGLDPLAAEDLARHHSAPVDAFEWYEVDRAVGNVRNKGPELISPL